MSRPDPHPVRWLPFTLAFLAVMLVANGLAGTFSGEIDPAVLSARGIGLDALRGGDVTRFVSAIFLSHDLPMLLRQLVFAAVVIGVAEWMWGGWRTAGLFFGLDIMATLALLAAVSLIPALAGQADITDVGMSMGGFGMIGALLGTTRWGLAGVGVVLALIAAKYALAPETLADTGHAIALAIGFLIGSYGAKARFLAPITVGTRQGRAPAGNAGWQSDGAMSAGQRDGER